MEGVDRNVAPAELEMAVHGAGPVTLARRRSGLLLTGDENDVDLTVEIGVGQLGDRGAPDEDLEDEDPFVGTTAPSTTQLASVKVVLALAEDLIEDYVGQDLGDLAGAETSALDVSLRDAPEDNLAETGVLPG